MTTVKEHEAIQQQFKERMSEGDLLNCMRCGAYRHVQLISKPAFKCPIHQEEVLL